MDLSERKEYFFSSYLQLACWNFKSTQVVGFGSGEHTPESRVNSVEEGYREFRRGRLAATAISIPIWLNPCKENVGNDMQRVSNRLQQQSSQINFEWRDITMVATVWNDAYPGIYIDGDAAFKASVGQDLQRIIGTDTSVNALNLIPLLSKRCKGIGAGKSDAAPAGGYRVIIQAADSIADTQALPDSDRDYMQNGPASANFKMHGTFAASNVYYLPGQENQYTALVGVRTPPYIALAHELIHALHSLSGDLRKQYGGGHVNDSGLLHEEARTVGLGIYAKTRISENAFRRRDNLAVRTFYSSVGDCDALTGVT